MERSILTQLKYPLLLSSLQSLQIPVVGHQHLRATSLFHYQERERVILFQGGAEEMKALFDGTEVESFKLLVLDSRP
jgi:hypothetical protein